MQISKRQFLLSAAGATALAALPFRLNLAFAADGFIEMTAGKIRKKLADDGPPSDLWAYNGEVPGPEIRVKKGERVRVRFHNKLEEPTSIHWHGIRIENAMDGVSGLTQEPVPPGGSFEYDFTVPDAGTFWYHAHNKSWNEVARGLYGPLIVEEPEPPVDDAHDITLVIDDWRLNREGAFHEDSLGALMDWSHAGRLGNWLTVNGKFPARFQVQAGELYRLRLINASNARIFEIDPKLFGAKILALDGQPLAAPAEPAPSPMLIGPAQRADLLLVPAPGKNFAMEEVSGEQPYPFAHFDVAGEEKSGSRELALIPNAIPEPDLKNARTIKLDMSGGAMGGPVDIVYKGKKLEGEDFQKTGQLWAFNGVANLPEEPFFQAKRGETILLETVNNTVFPHAIHLHGHHFRVIERSGSTVDEGRPWRDTFLVDSEQTVKIAFVADNPGKWLLHCHMLEHAAAGMNTWFEVA